MNHNAPPLGYVHESGVTEIEPPPDTLRAVAPPEGTDATAPSLPRTAITAFKGSDWCDY